MFATVLICVLSTLAFCLCTRGILAVSVSMRGTSVPWKNKLGFSGRAWRFAKGYFAVALTILAALSGVSAALSFIELFRL